MRTKARFPALTGDGGHYESFYLKASAPEGGRTIWIRHTFHRRPGEEATAAVWMTLFDTSRGRPRALKQQFSEGSVSAPVGSYIDVDGSGIGPGHARGGISAAGSTAVWDLRFSDNHEPLRHLPAEWMYSSRLPRTKLLSPHPGALFDGTFEIDGEHVALRSWPGMVGHNWGSEHAERWVWIHAGGFEEAEDPGDYLDIAAGQVRVGPLTTPWIVNGALMISGEPIRLGGLGRIRSTSFEAEPTGCRFAIPGSGGTVRGSVGAPQEQFVGWLYSNPSGGSHHALNCSVSDLRMTLERRGREDLELSLDGAAVYELGTHRTDHGIPIEPFEDG